MDYSLHIPLDYVDTFDSKTTAEPIIREVLQNEFNVRQVAIQKIDGIYHVRCIIMHTLHANKEEKMTPQDETNECLALIPQLNRRVHDAIETYFERRGLNN